MAIWQDLVDDHGFHARLREREALRAQAARRRDARGARGHRRRRPAQEAQVDYGEGPMVRDRETRQVQAHAALRADARLQPQVGAAARRGRRARADLGRAARARVSPARRRARSRRARQPARGRAHARHLRPDAQPALSRRARALRRRSRCRVACAIPIARARSSRASATRRRRRCAGLRFETLDEAQAYLDRWETHWADTRIHGTTKRQVAVMFAEEQPAPAAAAGRAVSLLPLRRAHRASRRLRRGRRRLLRRAAGLDRPHASTCSGTACACGSSTRRPAQLLREHLARSAAGIASPTTIGRRRRRRRPRRSCASARTPARTSAPLCEHIHRHDGEPGVRRILGVLSLAKKHGAPVVDDAAKAALELGAPNYRFLRRYLERRPPAPLTLAPGRPAHPPALALPRPHRTQNRRPRMNLIELDRALTQAAPVGHGRRPRDPTAPGADREARADSISSRRSSATSSLRRQDRLLGTPHQAGGASATPIARSTPSTSTSTRR